ncbi:MAG: serine/threonine protein kinase [Deltaproteobacteria bacterium]|nr:serine/threonine protein kinase [Deltaproteobacteria bacterium]
MTNDPETDEDARFNRRTDSPRVEDEDDNRFNRHELSPAQPTAAAARDRSKANPSRALGFERLLPERILGAVERLGFETSGHWFSLHCLENRVYDVRLEDERHLIAKFYRPGRWSREAILEEHELLEDLVGAEVPAVKPIRVDGQSLFELDGFFYALWPRVGGRSPEELTDEELDILGRFVARMHTVGASRAASHRVALTSQTYARAPLTFLLDHFVTPNLASRYERAVLEVADVYDEISRGVPVHRLHGDCHLGNLLRNNDAWFFVDFDDSVTGPAAQDLWLLVPSQDGEGQRQRSRIVDAYRQIRDFDDRWMRLFEPLRALRFVHYSAWVGRRIHEPAFASAFEGYGSESYWMNEIVDLEQRLRVIQGAELG